MQEKRAIPLALVHAALLPVICAGVAVILRIASGPQTIDDAFITFRYARNLADGLGFVYNAGQHVLGTTTPLYTLLLATLYRLTHISLPLLSSILGVGCDALTTIVIWLLTRRLSGNHIAATLAALLFALVPLNILSSQSGMETAFFTLLLIGATYCYVAEDPMGWGILLGLASVTRPEGVLFAGIFLIHASWAARRLPVRACIPLAAAGVPWLVWATWYFGSPIPLSALSKSQTHMHGLGLNLASIPLANVPLGNNDTLAGLLLLALVFGITWVVADPYFHPALFACTVLIGAWGIAGQRGTPIYGWYPAPLVPFLCVALGTAGTYLCRIRASIAILFFAVAILGAQLGQTQPLLSHWAMERLTTYQRLCMDLAPRLHPSDLILTPEVGRIGYGCPARMLDSVGLVSPGMAPYADGDILGRIHPALVAAYQPTYVTGLSVFLTPLLADAGFLRSYQQLLWLPDTTFGSHGLYLFVRKSAHHQAIPVR